MHHKHFILSVLVGTAALCLTHGAYPQTTNDKCGLPEHSAHMLDSPDFTRPAMQKSIIAGVIKVHYDTVGANAAALLDSACNRLPNTADAYADSVAAIANAVLIYQTHVLGYLSPPSDSTDGGGSEYDIYVMNLNPAYYGYTMPQRPLDVKAEGGRYSSYVAIDNDFAFIGADSNKGLPGLRITLAHELFHAIQLGGYGFWYTEMYYYELTATWMEDIIFPDVNDYFTFLTTPQSYFNQPDVSFTSNDLGMYSRCTWSHYMAERFGCESIRRTMELTKVIRPLQALDSTFKENSSGLAEAFTEWARWNLFTGQHAVRGECYPEGEFYPHVRQVGIEYLPPERTEGGTLPFLSSRYYLVALQDTMLTLTLSNVNIDAALANDPRTFPYSYVLSSSRPDSTFEPTGTSVFVKLNANDPPQWSSHTVVSVRHASTALIGAVTPQSFGLSQNYPNPFNPSTTIQYFLPQTSHVTISVYDILGRCVSILLSDVQAAGEHRLTWNPERIASGVYICRLSAGDRVSTIRMIVVR